MGRFNRRVRARARRHRGGVRISTACGGGDIPDTGRSPPARKAGTLSDQDGGGRSRGPAEQCTKSSGRERARSGRAHVPHPPGAARRLRSQAFARESIGPEVQRASEGTRCHRGRRSEATCRRKGRLCGAAHVHMQRRLDFGVLVLARRQRLLLHASRRRRMRAVPQRGLLPGCGLIVSPRGTARFSRYGWCVGATGTALKRRHMLICPANLFSLNRGSFS